MKPPCCPIHALSASDTSCSVPSASRRRILHGGVALGGAALATSLVLPHSAWADTTNVAVLEGNVMVNDVALRAGQSVATGDRIVTGPGSRLIFSIGDSAFQVRPDSELYVERSRLFVVGGLRLFSGAIVAVFGHGTERRVTTPTATVGIRGTGIYAEANATETYFCTCYGTTELHAGGHNETVTSTRHQARRLADTMGGSGDIVSAPEVRHTDDELAQLEALVGRKTPWASASGG